MSVIKEGNAYWHVRQNTGDLMGMISAVEDESVVRTVSVSYRHVMVMYIL